MAKSSNKKRKTGKTATKEQIEKERIVTMEALDEDASSGDEMPPEEEWNKEARALRQAIAEGAFEGLVKNSRKKKGADDDDDDDESFEEVVLGDDDEESEEEDDANDEDVEVEDEKAVKQDKDDSSSSEEEAGDLKKLVAAASDSEEEEDDDDDEEEDTIDRRNDMSSKALLVVTEELAAAKKHVPWAEQLFVVPPTPLPFGPDAEGEAQLGIHDDLKREVAFYDMALESVTEARLLCKEAGIPFTRPDDFFAEMVKDDDHMAKIKDRLIFENKKIEAVTQRKSNKEQKLRAVETRSNKLMEKAKRKKDHFKELDDWAQSAASNRGRGSKDDSGDGPYGARTGEKREFNKKRQNADKKYGHGGKKGRFKQNDAKGMNDMSGFNSKGNFAAGTKKTFSDSGANRKGKRARDASRTRR